MNNSIEEMMTWATMKEVKFLDWNKLIEKKEQDLETLLRLLNKNIKDVNVVKVVALMEKELNDVKANREEWLNYLNLPKHNDYKIVIFVQPEHE